MRLASGERLEEFIRRHPDARASLTAWKKNMEANSFGNFVELKRCLGAADYVKPNTVFNIAGNRYRLIATMDYEVRAVYVEAVLSHAEYDKGAWRR